MTKKPLLVVILSYSLRAQGPPAQLGPQSFGEKFMDFAVVTTGPQALAIPAFSAAIRMAIPPDAYPREWKNGASAFGRNYGSDLAIRSATETGRFLTGAILREDFRYRPSASRNPVARTIHAVAYTFVDQSDSGHKRIAFANFVGAGAGGFVGNLYLPPGFNNLSHAESRMAVTFAGFAAQNVAREFAPELTRVARKLHIPPRGLPIPEWWTPRN